MLVRPALENILLKEYRFIADVQESVQCGRIGVERSIRVLWHERARLPNA